MVLVLGGCAGSDATSELPLEPAASTPAADDRTASSATTGPPSPATTSPGAVTAPPDSPASSPAAVPDASTTQPTLPEDVPPPRAPFAAPALGTPIPAPQDENAPEPVVELGSIEIPTLDVNATLYEGIRLPTFDRGPGHWPGTAMPGEFGNAVVGGHRTSYSKPFRYLDRLVPGDEVVFTTTAGRFVYRVTSTEIVDPYEMRVVNQNPGFTATLFACHPVGSTRERIVVHLSLAQ